jgi:hypothetical protein
MVQILIEGRDRSSFYLLMQGFFQVVYDVNKKGMMIPFKGEKDICEELATASKNPAVATNLIKYNIGTRCPVKEVSSKFDKVQYWHALSNEGSK